MHARLCPPSHYISDHAKRKGNRGERDNQTTLQATPCQAVDTKKESVSTYMNRSIRLEYQLTETRGMYSPLG